jgi:Polyketide cyclase / dehydrase and lipid transport
MVRIYVRDVIDAPVEKVWGLIRDFNGMPKWGPFVRKGHIQNSMPSDATKKDRELLTDPRRATRHHNVAVAPGAASRTRVSHSSTGASLSGPCSLQIQLGPQAIEITAYGRHSECSAGAPERNAAVPSFDRTIDLQRIPGLSMTHIQHLRIVVRAPEKRHGVERLVPTNHVTRRSLALPFGDNPVLDANILACVGIGPTCNVACRKDPRNASPQIPVEDDAAVQRNPRLFRKSERRPYADTHDNQVFIKRLV